MPGPYSPLVTGLTSAADAFQQFLADRQAAILKARADAEKQQQQNFENQIKLGDLRVSQRNADTESGRLQETAREFDNPQPDYFDRAVVGPGGTPGTQLVDRRRGTALPASFAASPEHFGSRPSVGPNGEPGSVSVSTDTGRILPGSFTPEAVRGDAITTAGANGQPVVRVINPFQIGASFEGKPDLVSIRDQNGNEIRTADRPGLVSFAPPKVAPSEIITDPNGGQMRAPMLEGSVTKAPNAGFLGGIREALGMDPSDPVRAAMLKFPLGAPVYRGGQRRYVAGYQPGGKLILQATPIEGSAHTADPAKYVNETQ